jgi:hypothetical protein
MRHISRELDVNLTSVDILLFVSGGGSNWSDCHKTHVFRNCTKSVFQRLHSSHVFHVWKNYFRVCSVADVQNLGRCFCEQQKLRSGQGGQVLTTKSCKASFPQNFKTFAFEQDMFWTSSEQSMACPNSPGKGIFFANFCTLQNLQIKRMGGPNGTGSRDIYYMTICDIHVT